MTLITKFLRVLKCSSDNTRKNKPKPDANASLFASFLIWSKRGRNSSATCAPALNALVSRFHNDSIFFFALMNSSRVSFMSTNINLLNSFSISCIDIPESYHLLRRKNNGVRDVINGSHERVSRFNIYSYRKASIGFSREADRAEQTLFCNPRHLRHCFRN